MAEKNYVYDRGSRMWFWLDFDDQKFGGYTLGDFERLKGECRFLDIVGDPELLPGGKNWIIQPSVQPL